MESFTTVVPEANCQRLREAMGVAQHHDAVSGTEKQHVAYDYAKRLAIGAVEANKVIARVLGVVTKTDNLQFCPYANVSVCPASESADSFTIVAYNPLAHEQTAFIRVPLSSDRQVVVRDMSSQALQSQLVEVSPFTKAVRGKRGDAPVELVFEAVLPPMGYATYSVSPADHGDEMASAISEYRVSPLEDFAIENSFIAVNVSATTGRIFQMQQKQTASGEPLVLPLDQQFYWYNASVGNNISHQASGAYIFRPNISEPFPVNKQDNVATVTLVRGPVVQEVWQVFSNFTAQIVRLYSSAEHVELEYTVGPIPFKDHLGKEVISRFTTPLASEKVFYTDANGREMQRRVRDYRPTWTLNNTEPVAGNYYPVNSRIFLRDEKKGIQFTVLNDRSQGGSSLADGSLELMVHRRLQHDDRRGVGEALNETGLTGEGLIISGKHYLTLSPTPDAALLHRRLGLDLVLQPIIAFADATSTLSSGSFLRSTNVSKAVHILTLQRYYNSSDELLLRVENIFATSEGVGAATVNLAELFQPFTVVSADELTLSANLYKRDLHRLSWKTESKQMDNRLAQPVGDDLNVVLQPMEIRTFRVRVR